MFGEFHPTTNCSASHGLLLVPHGVVTGAPAGSANGPLKLTTGELLPAVETCERPSWFSEVIAKILPLFNSLQ